MKGTAAPDIVHAPDRRGQLLGSRPSCPPVAVRPRRAPGTWAQSVRPWSRPCTRRPDLEIIFDLAERLGLGEEFFGGDIQAAFDHQQARSGLSVRQLRDHPAGVRVSGQNRYRRYADIDATTGRPHGFQTRWQTGDLLDQPYPGRAGGRLLVVGLARVNSLPDLAADRGAGGLPNPVTTG